MSNTVTAEQLNELIALLRGILKRDPLLVEVAEILDVISKFDFEGSNG